MFIKSFAFLGLCTTLSLAAPVTSGKASNTNEIIYLANCARCLTTNSNCPYYRSTMAYYPNESQSENGEFPAAIVGASNLISFEGSTVVGKFSTENSFTVSIDEDAKSQKNFTKVGTGKNDKHIFNCYKDDQRVLYTDGSDTCYSLYFCQWQ